jgi:hypothetical protein
MTTSLIIKPEQKRLNRSIHTGVGQTNIRINLAPETGNRAQFARQMPEQRHHGSKRLDRSAEQRQGGREDVLLGECQIICNRLAIITRFNVILQRVAIGQTIELISVSRSLG